jgi:hypothetical protein
VQATRNKAAQSEPAQKGRLISFSFVNHFMLHFYFNEQVIREFHFDLPYMDSKSISQSKLLSHRPFFSHEMLA